MQARTKPQRPAGRIIALVLFMLAVPLLATINVVVGPYATLPYVALAATVFLFTLPLKPLLIGCLLIASVFAGLLEYFGHLNQGFWLPYLMGALFALRGFAERLRPAQRMVATTFPARSQRSLAVHPVALLAILYVVIVLFGLAVATPPLVQIIVAAKNFFFLWGVLLVLLWSPWRVEASSALWTTVVVVACVQWPVVLYQRFVVAAKRHDAAAWDAVVGTLGGDPASGGNSPAMAFVCCLAIGVLVWRLREKKIRPGWASLLILLCLLPIALAEVKAAFVWLVVVFGVLFGQRILREPVRAGLSLLLGLSLLGGLGLVYKTTYQSQQGSGVTLQQIYDKQIKYAVDPNEYSTRYHRLGRITTLVFWWSQHDLRSDPLALLVGHGLGSTRSISSLGMGEVARKLPVAVDRTAASALLWDVGLLGALAYTAVLVVAGVGALRLSQRPELPPAWRESTALAGTVLAMATLGLLYNSDAIDNATVQTLVYFSIAQVMLARRELAAARPLAKLPSGASRALATASVATC